MRFLEYFNTFASAVVMLLSVLYAYQMFYVLYSILHRKVPALKEAAVNHKYAIFVSARNESGVIGELMDSLNGLDYPREDYDVFVVADNCTDNTAEIAAAKNAHVYERQNHEQVGKGYALNYLYHKVTELKGSDYYDGFVVFDADNLVDKRFLTELNKKFDTGRYDALTTYRNSKNFSENWLTAAYSIWFMHEARHLNYVRDSIGAQCMISGTGFMVSAKLMKENDGWPYYFLTEDIQFSVASTLKGLRIGFVDSAILYDEQPAEMKQSWMQRLRWAKGFYQIDGKYMRELIVGSLSPTKKGHHFACYDVLMTVLPCSLLTVALVIGAAWIIGAAGFMPYYVQLVFRNEMIQFLGLLLLNMWLGMMALASVTVVSEWQRIHATGWQKVKYIAIFPMYMLTYLPISIQALFAKVQWTPIHHYSTEELAVNRK
jgi:cellulose synthase/poly-beta-1,6-N-acetylglucosamine synthase-like glycosyltransferase